MKIFRPIELAVIIAVLAIGAVIFTVATRRVRKGHGQTECFYNLRNIYGGYQAFLLSHGQFVTQVSMNAGGTKEYADQDRAVYLHFRVLLTAYTTPTSPNYPPIRDLICPKDQRMPAPLGSIFNTNISYFLSLNPPPDNDQWILAGNRNLTFITETNLGIRQIQKATWNPALGLHGDTGYLLFLDGAITRVDSVGLAKFFNQGGNPTNRIAIP